LVGLVALVGFIAWFAWNVWSLRGVWTDVYLLHDSSKPDADRIAAAARLANDFRLPAQERWEIALRKPLPPKARYLIAESFPGEVASADSAMFAKIVARSEGWPAWLRLLCLRTVAVAASEGSYLPAEGLAELERGSDVYERALLDYARAASGDREALARLRESATANQPVSPLAGILAAAIEVGSFERKQALTEATLWLRQHHPAAVAVWEGS
jgi:hypothetical protein